MIAVARRRSSMADRACKHSCFNPCGRVDRRTRSITKLRDGRLTEGRLDLLKCPVVVQRTCAVHTSRRLRGGLDMIGSSSISAWILWTCIRTGSGDQIVQSDIEAEARRILQIDRTGLDLQQVCRQAFAPGIWIGVDLKASASARRRQQVSRGEKADAAAE